jgi:hypothetical protein
VVDGFRAAVLASGSQPYGYMGKTGGAPTPFDAVDGHRLVGPQGSHPLAALSIPELIETTSDNLDGEITIKEPVRIGEALAGHLRVTARRDINARSAVFRLVGGLITESNRSHEDRDSNGNVTHSENWVQVGGKLFDELPFSQPMLPASLPAGQTFETDFLLPAPRLGPVTAHMGSAVLAWALEAKWDISMGGDERVAALVDVKQNIDYLRSGAVRLAEGSLYDAWQTPEGTIAVQPLPPALAGSEIEVTVNWPGAGGGRGGRFELQADVDAPNKLSNVVLWSIAVDPQAFRGGQSFRVPIPADAPATLADQGVAVRYTLRALVDRAFRSDLALERALAVM